MQNIPPLIFSSLSLVDPALTAFISWFVGLEGVPDILIWIGGVIIVGGVGIISYGDHLRSSSNSSSDSNDMGIVEEEEEGADVGYASEHTEEDGESGLGGSNSSISMQPSSSRLLTMNMYKQTGVTGNNSNSVEIELVSLNKNGIASAGTNNTNTNNSNEVRLRSNSNPKTTV